MPSKPARSTRSTTRSTRPKNQNPPTPSRLQLDAETWGERVQRAYIRGRREYSYTYREIADRVSQFLPTHDPALLRLNALEEAPTTRRGQMLAFYAILAYGFEPNDFDLYADAIGIDKEVEKRAREVLNPSSRCLTDMAA